ncbi:MAG: hypothetical protein OK454_07905, partial [Thaumarchaeota archaeon]|nr:hypothetical protein [Nitrososphaerota archaeon]
AARFPTAASPIHRRRPRPQLLSLPPSPAMAETPNANDELYPIAVLIDELKVFRIPGPESRPIDLDGGPLG